MSLLTEINWSLRRTAVRLAGEGPRQIGHLAVQPPECELWVNESPETFSAPGADIAVSTLPADVAAWPQVAATSPARQVWSVREAGLYDDDGVIYQLSTRRAFRETLAYWHRPPQRHPALGLRRGLPARRLDGLTIFLGGLGGQTFYHFLIENLPKLTLLRPWLASARRIVVQNYLEVPKTAWLRHVGVDLPIEWLPSLGHFQCEQLVFCPPLVTDCRPGPTVVARLRELAGARPARSRTRRIWASRRQDLVRRVTWEDELIRQLPAGWECVDFASLSPAEAVALMGECACFAGLHGAAFANLALAAPGLRVLEVYTAPHETWYPALSLSAGHHHEVAFIEPEPDLPALVNRLQQLAA